MRFSSIYKPTSPLLLPAVALLAGLAAQAQSLVIVSGNGQIARAASLSNQPLTVQLLDASGRPFPNQQIQFSDTASGLNGTVNTTAPLTDANGMTSANFTGANISLANGISYVQTNIIASFGSATAVFTETTSAFASTGGLLIQVQLVSPVTGQSIAGSAGSTGNVPIRILVNSLTSPTGVPNVSLSIAADSGTGTISCKEGANILTDATGTATCTPLFGSVGNGTFSVSVGGGTFLFTLNPFSITVGPPGIITVTSGNNQSGTPGQRLAAPIVAVVTDLAGNILSGAQVVFESVTPGGVSFVSSTTTSDPNGRVSTYVVLGTTPGPVQIRIRDVGNLVANPPLVTATVNITISGLNKVSGDGQTAFINAAFGQPLVVQVRNAAMQPVPSANVTFAVTSGSASVSPSSVLTDASGNASASVTAGGAAGPITITATAGAFSQTFTLTANPPGPTSFSYFNGASFEANRISPGAIVTINAQGLVGANVQGVAGGTLVGALPYMVAGVSVTIDNIPAPIFYVANQNGQQSVTVQIPFEVRATTVPIVIAVAGGGSTNAFVTVLPLAPGLFQTAGADGRQRVVALRPNGTVVSTTNPAGRGENIRVYLTGLGPVTPSVPTGAFSSLGSDSQLTTPLVAGINSNGVPIVQAIYARNLIGVYELTVTVPTDTVAFPSGTVPFSIAIQGASGLVYSNPSAIAIQ